MVVIEMKRLLYTGDLFIDLVLLRTHPSNQGKFSLVKINLPICFKFIKKFAYFLRIDDQRVARNKNYHIKHNAIL